MSVDAMNPASRAKAPRRKGGVDPTQLGLFDAPLVSTPKQSPPLQLRSRHTVSAVVASSEIMPTPAPVESPRRPSLSNDAPRMVAIEDMPNYPPELHATVSRMLGDLREDRVLMNYRAIRECFGISRATVARRVKEGLVPGVRMANGRVLDEGSVRRFDRTQLRWLLLAVRFAKNRAKD
jgi:hypothetical protein